MEKFIKRFLFFLGVGTFLFFVLLGAGIGYWYRSGGKTLRGSLSIKAFRPLNADQGTKRQCLGAWNVFCLKMRQPLYSGRL